MEEEEKEIETYYYHTFEKVMTWKKQEFKINAFSKEEADKKMIECFKSGDLDSGAGWNNDDEELLIPVWNQDDWGDGDEDYMTYEQNGDSPTYELYDDETDDVMIDNTPIEVIRNNKINYLLQYKTP